MKYCTYNITPPGFRIVKSNISENDFISIYQALDQLTLIRMGIERFQAVSVGIDTYKMIATSPLERTVEFLFLNYAFASWLNAFYSWIEFYEKHFSVIFGELKKQYYNLYFEYRTAYNLRIVSTHSADVINSIRYDLISGKKQICIGINELLQSQEHMQKKYVLELIKLQNDEKYIDSMKNAIKMKAILSDFQNNMFAAIKKDVKASLNLVLSILPNNLIDIYNTHLESDDKTIRRSIGPEVSCIIKKMIDVYPAFLEDLSLAGIVCNERRN